MWLPLVALPVIAPVPVDAASGPRQCVTRTLSAEQLARGDRSEVTCYDGTGAMLRAMQSGDACVPFARASTVPARCSPSPVRVAAAFSWRVSGTTRSARPSTGSAAESSTSPTSTAGGANQITTGGTANMNGTLNDQASSVYYYTS